MVLVSIINGTQLAGLGFFKKIMDPYLNNSDIGYEWE